MAEWRYSFAILDLEIEMSGQLHTPDALPPGESPWYPMDRKLAEPKSQYGRYEEKKNFARTRN
jgi:hypothetical protein